MEQEDMLLKDKSSHFVPPDWHARVQAKLPEMFYAARFKLAAGSLYASEQVCAPVRQADELREMIEHDTPAQWCW
jgi:hypothetical protein